MALNPQAVADKWASRVQGSTQEVINGVNAVTQAPGAAAAAQADLWLAKVTASKDKWRNNVGKVTLSEWKDKMLNVGVGRIAAGAQANKPKMAAFMTQFLPHVEAGAAMVKSMPKMTLEDSVQRAAAMIRHNASFKRS